MVSQLRPTNQVDELPFRVLLNGFFLRECWTESEAIDQALDVKLLSPRSKIAIVNIRAGTRVELTDLTTLHQAERGGDPRV